MKNLVGLLIMVSVIYSSMQLLFYFEIEKISPTLFYILVVLNLAIVGSVVDKK